MNAQEIEETLSRMSGESPGADKDPIEVRNVQFRQLTPDKEPIAVESSTATGLPPKMKNLMDVSLTIAIELGRTTMLVRDLLDLGVGSIIELEKMAGETIDIYVNEKKFAEGEVVVIDENFGVRITKLLEQE